MMWVVILGMATVVAEARTVVVDDEQTLHSALAGELRSTNNTEAASCKMVHGGSLQGKGAECNLTLTTARMRLTSFEQCPPNRPRQCARD